MRVLDNLENYDIPSGFHLTADQEEQLAADLKEIVLALIPLRSSKLKTRQYFNSHLRYTSNVKYAQSRPDAPQDRYEFGDSYTPLPGEYTWNSDLLQPALLDILREDMYSFGFIVNYIDADLQSRGNDHTLCYRPITDGDSRYSEAGWDWNRLPGTTTIHLPWDRLNSPNKGTLMERNDSRFPGVSSLEGRNGVLAFTYTEKDRPHFCAGATATQSVFCFDNRIVFIGSGISNDSAFPTETTLFQQHLSSSSEGILIDGNLFALMPQTWRGEGAKCVVEDLKGNAYVVPDSRALRVYRARQSSPDNTGRKKGEGEFVSAVLVMELVRRRLPTSILCSWNQAGRRERNGPAGCHIQ